MKSPRIIHAAELTDYGYCARSWFLRRIERISPNRGGGRRHAGETLHRRHGLRVALIPIVRVAAALVLLIAAALFAAEWLHF